MMRILQVLLSPRIGGAESAAAGLASSWEEIGHTCTTTFIDDEGKGHPLQRIRRLHTAIRKFNPDVILAHSALPNIYARLVPTRIPVACVLHSAARDMDDKRLRYAEQILWRKARVVIAVSVAQRDEYLAHFPNQRVVVVPNGVSNEYQPSPKFTPSGPIITVGRIVAQKDPELWSQVSREISESDPTAQFEWHGPTSTGSEWNRLMQAHRSPNSPARFCGPTDQIGEVLASASVFFHPARREAHSMAILEAAASGLPVVCSKEVATTLPAWLPLSTFAAGVPSEAVEALQQVRSNIEVWRRRALQAAPRVHDEFGLERTAKAYLDELSYAVSHI